MLPTILGVLTIGIGLFIGVVWLVYTYDILWRRAGQSERRWLLGFTAALAAIIAVSIFR